MSSRQKKDLKDLLIWFENEISNAADNNYRFGAAPIGNPINLSQQLKQITKEADLDPGF